MSAYQEVEIFACTNSELNVNDTLFSQISAYTLIGHACTNSELNVNDTLFSQISAHTLISTIPRICADRCGHCIKQLHLLNKCPPPPSLS